MTSTAEAETTHISDSMPGTAAEGPSLQEQLAEMQKKVELAQDNERRALAIAKASAKRTQELDATLNDRQTNYEDLSKQFRLTTSALENEKLQKERALTRSVNSDERNKKLNAEIADLKTKLSALQASNMSSPDEKAAEIARLQKENEDMAKKLNSALKDKSSADSMLEYIKDELRTAQSQAAEWKSRCEAANSELEHLQPIAAGEVTKTKEIHYQRSTELLRQQYEHTKMVNLKMEKVLQQKEEEIQRLKGGARDRYGTRQSSVPRSPRVGSRAGSPAPRDRVSNLRNG